MLHRLRLWHGIRWPVTGSAVPRSWLVEQNRFACDQLGQLVTLGAAYVLMGSSQRERRPRLMVEERGPPLRRVMAVRAAGDAVFTKLLAMDIFMAVFTLLRSGFEVDVHQLGFKIERLVAVDTRRGTVCSQQRELRLGVIEARKFLPRLCRVAGLTSADGSISAF